MIIKNFRKSPSEKIREILAGINLNKADMSEGIYLDEVLNLFLKLKGELTVPGISVKELDYKTAVPLFEEVVKSAPGYFYSHNFVEKRKPAAEEHSLQFCSKLEGVVADFVHVIRINFRYTPGSGSIISQGNSDTYPSYKTDRLFYKSRLVPVKKGSIPEEVESLKIKDFEEQEADNRLFTSVVFDEGTSGSMSAELSRSAGQGLFPVPVSIYPFVVYDYFTACLALPDPFPGVIERGAEIYEPLFFYIYSKYRNSEEALSAVEAFPGSLSAEKGTLSLTGDYTDKLKFFFSSYSIYTDDDLMLEGLRRVEVSRSFEN
jgi:hypothetical protein